MILSAELKTEVRRVFEGEAYYARTLNDSEVQQIADNLVSYGAVMIDFVKNVNEKEAENGKTKEKKTL